MHPDRHSQTRARHSAGARQRQDYTSTSGCWWFFSRVVPARCMTWPY